MAMPATRSPQVAIMGRPNVGKSTLFNILTRSRKAVVRNESGVTRDVNLEPADWWGHEFDVVDTGGITEASDTFSQLIKQQVSELINNVDLLIVVMDGKSGLVPEDRDIIKLAKQSGKPMFLVVNKVDQMQNSELILAEFYEFGIDVIACSFEKRDSVDVIVEWIIGQLPEEPYVPTHREGVRLAVIGKPNAGKSSLCNFLLDKNRMMVSSIAGTTVDAVEAQFKYNEKDYVLIDTAGLRRQSKRKDGVEVLSSFKSYDAIRKADVVLLVIDGVIGPSVQEAKMVEYILDRHKAVIVVSNKIDLAKKERPEFRKWYREQMNEKFHFFDDIPQVFISAKTGSGINDLFSLIEDVWVKMSTKIKTSKLNDFFFESIRQAPAPVYGTKNVKFYYLTQTHQVPPSFIAFANQPEGVTTGYRRFLIKRIKQRFDLQGIPIRIFCMKSKKNKKTKTIDIESDHELINQEEAQHIQEHIQEYELGEPSESTP